MESNPDNFRNEKAYFKCDPGQIFSQKCLFYLTNSILLTFQLQSWSWGVGHNYICPTREVD
jgi:hypothetical protein